MVDSEAADGYVKIRFYLEKDEDGYPPMEVETVWALPAGEHFRLDNIPFYVRGVSCDDIVSATGSRPVLEFHELITASGNSTYRMTPAGEVSVTQLRSELREQGLESELDGALVAVNVPPGDKHRAFREYLKSGFLAGRFDYEEACLGEEVDPWEPSDEEAAALERSLTDSD